MKRVFGFGSAAVDFRITTADLGENYKDKLLARETVAMGGGACANCMVQVARLGGQSYWLGKLGRDWVANKILADLKSENVNCDYVLQDSGHPSPFNLAIYAGESKRRVGGFLLPNSLDKLTENDINTLISNIDAGDIAYVEIGEINLKTSLLFCREAKKQGSFIVVDVDLDPEKQCIGDIDCFHEIMKLSDVMVPNLNAVSGLINELRPQYAAQMLSEKYSAIVVVTAGDQGAYYSINGVEAIHQLPFKTTCVDTVGAGDAFHGGLVYGLANGIKIKEAVELASKCGAHACRGFGARSSMPRSCDLI